jgi:hypothetical protein
MRWEAKTRRHLSHRIRRGVGVHLPFLACLGFVFLQIAFTNQIGIAHSSD